MVLHELHTIGESNMAKAIYPGSFDPITKGHLNIIERAARIFDEVQVVILNNIEKNMMFTIEERNTQVIDAVKHLSNVTVCFHEGLTADICNTLQVFTIIRGVRGMSDYEYEMQIASVNAHLDSRIETIFMISDPQYTHISSSNMKAVAAHNGDISSFVTKDIEKAVFDKIKYK